MTDNHHPEIPAAIESVVARLGELQAVFGPRAAPVLAAVQTGLVAAMAARDRGDSAAVVEEIGRAMDRLSSLADHLDPAEAMMMRAVAERFRAALLRGDAADAKQSAAVMFDRSGAVERPKS